MENKIEQIFKNLESWRKLPKYQLERRLDIFFSIYLKEIVEVFYKEILKEEIQLSEVIIPEFPLKKDGSNNSTNVDYVMFCKKKTKVILTELKTDVSSVNDKQIEYLKKSKDIGWNNLHNGIKEIYKHLQKGKYPKSLIKYKNFFESYKDILIDNHEMELDVIYIQPSSEKILIPKKYLKENDSIKEFHSIGFDFIIKNILEKENDIISQSFSKILKEIIAN